MRPWKIKELRVAFLSAGASVRSTAGLRLSATTPIQRFRRGVCPQTVRLYGKGTQQSMKRCMGAFKRETNQAR
jgi:hypothetical protein